MSLTLIGQREAETQLNIMVGSHGSMGMPHLLFSGPPGTGKTHAAELLAETIGTPLVKVNGPALRTPADLYATLAQLSENGILFIDEIHALSRRIADSLLKVLTEYRFDMAVEVRVGRKKRTQVMSLIIPRFTLVCATTDVGLLPPALVSRLHVIRFDFYSTNDLVRIGLDTHYPDHENLSEIVSVKISNAMYVLAECSKGVPREMLRLIELLKRYMTSINVLIPDGDIARTAVKVFGYNTYGLDRDQRAVLTYLHNIGHPVGLNTLAAGTGMSVANLKENIEPYLLRRGLLLVAPGGRSIGPNFTRSMMEIFL